MAWARRVPLSRKQSLKISSSKTISGASFSLYIFDKSKARISERYVNLTNVAAGQTVKFQMTMSASWHSRFGGHRDERSADHVYHR